MATAIKKVFDVNNAKHNHKVEVQLADECKNGHQDFSITATFWNPGAARTDRKMITAGCCHEDILKVYPELKIFVDLHLSDYLGRPMYAAENGRYHFNNSSKEVAMNYLRISAEEYESLKPYAIDEGLFAHHFDQTAILARWKQEADVAIKQLEEWTGEKFEVNSTRSNYTPLKDADTRCKTIEEAVALREKVVAEKNQKEANELVAEYTHKIFKASLTRRIIRALVLEGLPLSNLIIYDHYKRPVFNFNWKSYEEIKVTQEQIDAFNEKYNFDAVIGIYVK